MFSLVKDIRYTHVLMETMTHTNSKNFTMLSQFFLKRANTGKIHWKNCPFQCISTGSVMASKDALNSEPKEIFSSLDK